MKKIIFLFVFLALLSCKKDTIDPIQSILGAYYGDIKIPTIEPLLALVPTSETYIVNHRALITKKDDKTLLIEYRYFAACNTHRHYPY